ncbi:thioredoxin domain-containing protein [Plesiomonas shigelloides]|uniref:DsbA family protein n=1 Tax=Plesiomonas shigelloides TaxID=703 RepID=UPI0012629E96|nr:DsbA family protein [Plesiomonas shigelloides]KAB7714800.1 thioredoxin domain-containing protein [Plesiomonas shigelloides]
MLSKLALVIFSGLLLVSPIEVTFAASEIKEGEQYITLKAPVMNAPSVVEFFSFYCPPCGAFAERYKVSDAINKRLPSGQHVDKIHVTMLGPLGYELTRAWAVAKVLGVEEKLERPLFVAVQVKRCINTPEDIRQVFIEAGVPAMVFDSTLISPEVMRVTEQQIQLAKEFSVTRTPSFYVAGRYLILNNGVESRTVDGVGEGFSLIASELLKLSNDA